MATPADLNGIDLDTFRGKVDDTKVECMICHHKSHSLIKHLKDQHNQSAGQYKSQFPDARLASPIISELIRVLPRKGKTNDNLSEFLGAFSNDSSVIPKEIAALMKESDASLAEFVPSRIPEFYFDPVMTKAMAWGVSKGLNIYIEGPTGCGKTELAIQTHAVAKRAIKRVNMNGDVTVANFIGKREVDPTRGTYYSYGSLPKAMKEGMTLLIDEIDYMPPSIAAVLNPVLESKRMLYLPETDETIYAKEGFAVIATGNTSGKGDGNGVYTGTEVLNTAMLDRFQVKLTASYLPDDKELKMLEARFPNADRRIASSLIKAANEIRASFLSGNMPYTVSTRKLIDILEMIGPFPIEQAVKLTILNWMDKDNQAVVAQILDRCGIKGVK